MAALVAMWGYRRALKHRPGQSISRSRVHLLSRVAFNNTPQSSICETNARCRATRVQRAELVDFHVQPSNKLTPQSRRKLFWLERIERILFKILYDKLYD